MNHLNSIAILVLFACSTSAFSNPDDILFKFNWETKPITEIDENHVDFATLKNENFKCILPKKTYSKERRNGQDHGFVKSELKLLEPIFNTEKCSVRIESYWAFELCHNKHIRQYHPVLITGQKLQEYFLGYHVPYISQFDKKPQSFETIKIESEDYPYYKIEFLGGDFCELINQKRSTSVLYVCSENSFADIYQVTEVESCQYQIIVLTRFLCEDPKYKPQRAYLNEIKCFNTNTTISDPRPKDLINITQGNEQRFSKPSNIDGLLPKDFLRDIKIEAIKENNQILLHFDLDPVITDEEPINPQLNKKLANQPEFAKKTDIESVKDLIQEELKKMTEEIDQYYIKGQKNIVKNIVQNELDDPEASMLVDFLAQRSCLKTQKDRGSLNICFNKHILYIYKDDKGKTHSVVYGVFNPDVNAKLTFAAIENQDPIMKEGAISFFTNGGACGSKVRSARLVLKCSSDKRVIIREFEENCVHTVYVESENLC